MFKIIEWMNDSFIRIETMRNSLKTFFVWRITSIYYPMFVMLPVRVVDFPMNCRPSAGQRTVMFIQVKRYVMRPHTELISRAAVDQPSLSTFIQRNILPLARKPLATNENR